jgi:transposase-like protein
MKSGMKLYYILQCTKKEMVKVIETPERPKYHCNRCNKDFPSVLDLEEHVKIDHAAAVSMA